MSNSYKAVAWALILSLGVSTFTACSNKNKESQLSESLETTEEIDIEATTENDEGCGIFVEFNEYNYSVDMDLESIYNKNGIEIEPIGNILDSNSGLYYEIGLKLSEDDIKKLRDATGAYVAEIDINSLELKNCGAEIWNTSSISTSVTKENIDKTEPTDIADQTTETTDQVTETTDQVTETTDQVTETTETTEATSKIDTNTVLIMFGDKKLLDDDYLKQTFNTNGETRTLFAKGTFRGRIALYPMLVEKSDGTVYVFKPFLDMSKT